jgi:hypothetical protein
MTKMNMQQVFDAIWERAKDKRKALRNPLNPDSVCAYRSPDGLKCFIGTILPDDSYDTRMDCSDNEESKYSGLDYVVQFLPIDKEVNVNWLFSLQRVHDNWNADRWEERLRDIARRLKLTVPS